MPNPKARPAPLPELGGKPLPATTADLVLSVSKTTVHLETLELLAVPTDAVRGFDVKHKRNGPNDLFVHGLVGPLSWARELSRSMQQAAGQDPSSTPLLVLADGALPYRVIVEIDEVDIARVRQGQRGRLVVSSQPWESRDLRVDRITPLAKAVDGRNVFEVEAQLVGAPDALRPGLLGRADLIVGRLPPLWAWSRHALDRARLAWWSWTG